MESGWLGQTQVNQSLIKMTNNCPKGYYWDGSKCRKSITMKRKGIYGKGFLSEPQSEQYAKIRKEDRIENPILVEKQMSALNAFQHGKGPAHKDLEYAEKQAHKYNDPRCIDGEIWIHGYTDRYGKVVKGHCRRERRRR